MADKHFSGVVLEGSLMLYEDFPMKLLSVVRLPEFLLMLFMVASVIYLFY